MAVCLQGHVQDASGGEPLLRQASERFSAKFSIDDYDKTMTRGRVMAFKSDFETDAEAFYRCYADR